MRHQLAGRRFHLQAQVGGLAVGAADAKLFHLEAAVMLHHFVEDVLHYVGVDQVAFRFDNFLYRHKRFLVAWGPRAPPRAPGGSMSYRQYCLLVLAAAAPALAQPSVDQILTAYAQALGGQAAYEKVTTRAMKGTVEIPDDNVTGTALVVAKAPGSFRLTMDIPGYGVVETVLDGGNGWEKNPDSGTHAMSKADFAGAQRDRDFYRQVRLKELYPKMHAARAFDRARG